MECVQHIIYVFNSWFILVLQYPSPGAYRDFTVSPTTSYYNSPHTTWSDYSDLSSGREPITPPGILKPHNSGPTCDMPIRFQLPESGRIVYPEKNFQDRGYDRGRMEYDESSSNEEYFY